MIHRPFGFALLASTIAMSFAACGGGSGTSDAPACPDAPCTQPPLEGVRCGNMTCGATDVCCTDPLMTSMQSCAASCDVSDYTRRCDGPEDCSGANCCGGDTPVQVSHCMPATPDCGIFFHFCHSSADCPTALPHCCANQDVRICGPVPQPGCN